MEYLCWRCKSSPVSSNLKQPLASLVCYFLLSFEFERNYHGLNWWHYIISSSLFYYINRKPLLQVCYKPCLPSILLDGFFYPSEMIYFAYLKVRHHVALLKIKVWLKKDLISNKKDSWARWGKKPALLTQSKWNMAENFGIKFHLSYFLHIPKKDFFLNPSKRK